MLQHLCGKNTEGNKINCSLFRILSYKFVLKDHLSSLIQEGTLEDEAKVNKCLHNFKRINDLIKELNSTSQWVFINGMLTMLTTVLCYFFQFFSWYAEFGAAALVGLAPGIIPCLVTLHCLCEAASAIEIEVH